MIEGMFTAGIRVILTEKVEKKYLESILDLRVKVNPGNVRNIVRGVLREREGTVTGSRDYKVVLFSCCSSWFW